MFLPYIETHICDQCNLKCVGCSHFSPIAKPRYKDITEFDIEFARLAELFKIGVIRIMGGEPLLNPDWIEYCRIARNHFPESAIALVTNGTLNTRLLPHIDELNDLRIDVTMSEYGLDIDRDPLKLINTVHIHDKQNLYNISLDLDCFYDGNEMFDRCDLHRNRWYFYQDGNLYHCCVAGNIDTFRFKFFAYNLPSSKQLGVNIFTHTAEQIMQELAKPTELCEHCRTDLREASSVPHCKSSGDIKEWTI